MEIESNKTIVVTSKMRILVLMTVALLVVGSLFSCKKSRQRENVVKVLLYVYSAGCNQNVALTSYLCVLFFP
jgi:hypothetical protein